MRIYHSVLHSISTEFFVGIVGRFVAASGLASAFGPVDSL
jgi:hypothetical protein